MMRRIFGLSTLMAVLLGMPSISAAQQPLADLLPNLYSEVLDINLGAFVAVFGPGAKNEILTGRQFDALQQTTQLLGSQLSSFPLGSSAGGFTWTFEPGSGTFTRASESFGPIFAERALTAGRNKLNFGVNYQRSTFDQIEGKKLTGDEIQFYTGLVRFGIFFVDALDLNVTADTVNVFGTYGVTDRLDVGVAVPITRISMNATITSRVGGTLTGVRTDLQPLMQSRSGSASGLGDVVLRGKYNFLKGSGGGLAGGIDVRLPTGNELDLLGNAGGQRKFYLVGSSAFNKLSPHFNFGYTVSGASDAATGSDHFVFAPPDEISYVSGVDVALTPRTTIAGDILGRTLRDIGRLREIQTEFGPNFREFEYQSGNLHQLLGSAGVKFNPWSNMLVSANFLFPLSDRGLTDNLTWLLGFDYSF
jgi:hypothetical protein